MRAGIAIKAVFPALSNPPPPACCFRRRRLLPFWTETAASRSKGISPLLTRPCTALICSLRFLGIGAQGIQVAQFLLGQLLAVGHLSGEGHGVIAHPGRGTGRCPSGPVPLKAGRRGTPWPILRPATSWPKGRSSGPGNRRKPSVEGWRNVRHIAGKLLQRAQIGHLKLAAVFVRLPESKYRRDHSKRRLRCPPQCRPGVYRFLTCFCPWLCLQTKILVLPAGGSVLTEIVILAVIFTPFH